MNFNSLPALDKCVVKITAPMPRTMETELKSIISQGRNFYFFIHKKDQINMLMTENQSFYFKLKSSWMCQFSYISYILKFH